MSQRPPLRVTIASPCRKDWNQMKGSAQKRFCEGCQQHVYDLSALRYEEAKALIEQESAPCVRLFQRGDGTVMTADCPVGRERARRKLRHLVAVAAAAVVALVAAVRGFFGASAAECEVSPLAPIEGLATSMPEPSPPVADDSWMAARRAQLPRPVRMLMMGKRMGTIQVIRGEAKEK